MNPQASGPEHDRPRRSPGHRGLLCPACINDVRQIRTHKGLLRRRGLVTQRLPGAPPAGKTPQTHPAAQAKKPRSQPHANPHSLSTWCWAPLPDWLAALLAAPPAANPRPECRSAGPDQVHDLDRYTATALRQETERVRAAAEGGRNHALNKAAFHLGQLIAAGALPEDLARAELSDAASVHFGVGSPPFTPGYAHGVIGA